ncbi:hypothetical protein NL676_016628 [Syzygium grande]|nr:hypothetical protein NL676_016628 [Syzygium grande]
MASSSDHHHGERPTPDEDENQPKPNPPPDGNHSSTSQPPPSAGHQNATPDNYHQQPLPGYPPPVMGYPPPYPPPHNGSGGYLTARPYHPSDTTPQTTPLLPFPSTTKPHLRLHARNPCGLNFSLGGIVRHHHRERDPPGERVPRHRLLRHQGETSRTRS